MNGGSSKSSSSSSNSTETSSATSTGTVGNVLQGQNITITDNLPPSVEDVFKQLTALTGQAVDIAAQAGQKALDSTNQLAQATKQPDVTLIQGYQTQIYYAIAAVVAIVAIHFIFGKK